MLLVFLFLVSPFSVTGKSSGPDISHSIVSGDNFISPAVKTATNVSVVLASLLLGSDYSDVKRFNATSQTWESYAQGQFSQFEPGKGYNIIGLATANFSYGNTQQTTTMVYDSTGSRVKKQITSPQSLTTIYLGKDYEVEGSKTTKYIFLGDRRIAVNSKLNTQNSELLFIHSDHINSSNVVTDASGNQSVLLEYDPYGETVTQTGSADLKHKYTGQERDDSSHLYYYGARYYDPQIGRFITADPTVQHPTDPQDLNRYAYGRNNPIKYTDPTGLGFWKKLFGFIGAVIGAIVGSAIPGVGPVLGAIIGGALGGAIGGTIDAAISGNGLLKGAVFGAAEGAAIGVAVGTAASGGGGGGEGPGSIEILIRKQAEKYAERVVKKALNGFGLEKTVETIAINTVGTGVAYAAEMGSSSARKSISDPVQLRIFSRPTESFNGQFDHLFAVEESGKTIELSKEGNLNTIHRSVHRSHVNQQYLDKLKGGLEVTVDKQRFEAAVKSLTERYHGNIYNPWNNSNDFIINLLQQSGRPLTEEELAKLGITRQIGGFMGVIIFEPTQLFRLRSIVGSLPYGNILLDKTCGDQEQCDMDRARVA